MTKQYQTMEERVSYGIGRQMGDQLSSNSITGISIDAVLNGLADSMNGVESAVSQDDLHAAFSEMHQRLQDEEEIKGKALAADGEKFLEENAKHDHIHVTDSGLQFQILIEGDGKKPTNTSTVLTHYHGTLIDGTVFDSSVQRDEPAELPVDGVIAGWTEALQMMNTGSKWRLFVPYNLAYGERGAGDDIAPYSTLIFDIELLEIVD